VTRRPYLAALAALTALTVFLTWPQALHLATRVAPHQDPLLSGWRLAWIAHALATNPTHVYDGNIFYPERRTLAYSDATFLQGALGAPLFWLHLPTAFIYNLLLLAGILSSGMGLFVLARHLTRNDHAALVGAAVFTLVPYRIEHFMHLELQWAAGIPLALWALHRAIEEGSWRFGALAGMLIALQFVSCIYYGLFLMMTAPILVALLLAFDRRRALAALPPLALAVVVGAAIATPFALPYLQNARTLGVRGIEDVAAFSARPINYLATPFLNWVWGWTAERFGATEVRLFPGLIAILLAAGALGRRAPRIVWIYVVLLVFGVEMSLGVNGHLYRWVYDRVWPLHALRAAARFAIVAYCALAVLVAFGYARLEQRLVAAGRRAGTFAAGAIVLIALECGSAPMRAMELPRRPPEIYRYLQTLETGVVVELPMPMPWGLPAEEPQYVFWSTQHWKPIVNGYSGYASAEYMKTLHLMMTFPDDPSIARLRELNVRYILVHQDLFDREPYTALVLGMAARRDFLAGGQYRDWRGWTHVFELKPAPPAPQN